MDMRMPEIDGIERRAAIGSRTSGPPGLKIVATSASALEHEREEYLKAGCDDFVAKPFRAERIYDCLQHLLGVEFEYEAPAAEPGSRRPSTSDRSPCRRISPPA